MDTNNIAMKLLDGLGNSKCVSCPNKFVDLTLNQIQQLQKCIRCQANVCPTCLRKCEHCNKTWCKNHCCKHMICPPVDTSNMKGTSLSPCQIDTIYKLKPDWFEYYKEIGLGIQLKFKDIINDKIRELPEYKSVEHNDELHNYELVYGLSSQVNRVSPSCPHTLTYSCKPLLTKIHLDNIEYLCNLIPIMLSPSPRSFWQKPWATGASTFDSAINEFKKNLNLQS